MAASVKEIASYTNRKNCNEHRISFKVKFYWITALLDFTWFEFRLESILLGDLAKQIINEITTVNGIDETYGRVCLKRGINTI